MGFLQSAINQVGRDMGKVVSNAIFQDAHAIPIRSTGGGSTRSSSKVKYIVRDKDEREFGLLAMKAKFDKSIDFATSFRPQTLVNKLSGAYSELKSLINHASSDDHIDREEGQTILNMVIDFNDKLASVVEILELDEEGNSKQLEIAKTLYSRVMELFYNGLLLGIKSCQRNKETLNKMYNEIENRHTFSFLGFGSSDVKKRKQAIQERIDLEAKIEAAYQGSLDLFTPKQ